MDTALCLRVAGFRTASTTAGIKQSGKPDMGIIVADAPAAAAGVFTTSVAAAAPVHVSRQHLKTSDGIKAVLINSGNANACTGAEGEANCRQLGERAAQALGCPPEAVLHASTGVIGHQLPMDIMETAIPVLAESLSVDNGFALARTIMTTDLVPKWTVVKGYIDGTLITIAGIAKGSGMIAPNMATMLGFVLTDAAIAPDILQQLWLEVSAATFNRVTVDTDTSTNDSGFVMASAAAGNTLIDSADSPEGQHFKTLLMHASKPLAKMIAADGEGATKLIKVEASGFGSDEGCLIIARTVAESPLVKTAMFGNDPNWGRIIAAAGRSGIDFAMETASIGVCNVPVFVKGTPVPFDRPALAEAMKSKEVNINITCSAGGGTGYMFTCDYSYDYIKINAEYHT